MRNLIVILTLAMGLLACDTNTDCVELNIVNLTDEDFDQVESNALNFGLIPANSATPIQVASQIHDWPSLRGQLDSEDYSYGYFFCGVGVEYIKEGKYRIEIQAVDKVTKTLKLELIKE